LADYQLPRLVFAGKPTNQVVRDWHWQNLGQPVPYAIYHLFNRLGRPIYVGVTNCLPYRFESHRRRYWWPQVAYMNLYLVPTRVDALYWEKHAIHGLQPRYNKAHRPKEVWLDG